MQVSRKAVGVVLVGLLILTAMMGGYSALPSRADDPATLKYRLQHVFKDGQIIRGEVCRERLMYVPGQVRTNSESTTSEMLVNLISDRPREKQSIALSWRNVHSHAIYPSHDGRVETTDFDAADARGKPENFGGCLLGRKFTLEIDPSRKATLVSGVDEYLAALQPPRPEDKKAWVEAIQQIVDQPNAYFPLQPVSVGETWMIRRKLRIIPMGNPFFHSFGTVEPWEENVSAKLAGIKGSGKDQLAIVGLSGTVARSGYRTFQLTGEIRVLVEQQSVTSLTVTLVDPTASAGKLDPTSKILIRLDITQAGSATGGHHSPPSNAEDPSVTADPPPRGSSADSKSTMPGDVIRGMADRRARGHRK